MFRINDFLGGFKFSRQFNVVLYCLAYECCDLTNFFPIFFKGNAQYLEQQQQMQNGEIKRKESLTPPPKRDVTWSEYIQSPAGQHPVLGRASKCKESSRAFKATVAMSEDFPLTVEMLLNVLEVIAPQFKHFQKLRDFIEMKLPPGFPVKVDIPVLPTVSARVTFHDFHWKNQEEKLSDDFPFIDNASQHYSANKPSSWRTRFEFTSQLQLRNPRLPKHQIHIRQLN